MSDSQYPLARLWQDFNDAVPQSQMDSESLSSFDDEGNMPPSALAWKDFNDALPQSRREHADKPEEADDIRQRIHRRLREVLFYLYPNGEEHRHYFSIGDVQGHEGQSMKIELDNDKAGLWYDFATGEGGDIFDLWGKVRGFHPRQDFPRLLDDIRGWLGESVCRSSPHSMASSAKSRKDKLLEDWGHYTGKWDYLDTEGRLIACMYRYDTPKGKKFQPWDVKRRASTFPVPRPLYRQPEMRGKDHIVLVEGEKCVDIVSTQGICATTAMGGAKAHLDKTDWSPLRGKHVLVWPDNDDPGHQYAQKVSHYLMEQKIPRSMSILSLPEGKPEGWDAADAVAEGMDIMAYIGRAMSGLEEIKPRKQRLIAAEVYLHDKTPLSQDLIAPGILIPESLLLLGGAPKVGKTDFLLHWLFCLASGRSYLGMTPPRPLRIAYIQTEIGYERLKQRAQAIPLQENEALLIGKNLFMTDKEYMTFTEEEVMHVAEDIRAQFRQDPVDLIVVDPLRNVFDGKSENDNQDMIRFLKERIHGLRLMTHSRAGVMLVHHTKKVTKKMVEEDPFQALSGAGSLRGFYDTGMVMFRPDNEQPHRHIFFDLRHDAEIPQKSIMKINGLWQEVTQESERVTRKEGGKQMDRERQRRWNVILDIIRSEALRGQMYTATQFSEAFVNKAGLGSESSVLRGIKSLCTAGYIKFNQDEKAFQGSQQGVLCIEGMKVPTGKEIVDPETGEITGDFRIVLPTHFKDIGSGAMCPVENPTVWVYNQSSTLEGQKNTDKKNKQRPKKSRQPSKKG